MMSHQSRVVAMTHFMTILNQFNIWFLWTQQICHQNVHQDLTNRPAWIESSCSPDLVWTCCCHVRLARENLDRLCTMLRGFDGTRESEHDSASESEHGGAREPIYNHIFCRKRTTRHEIILNLLIARMIEFRDFRPKSTTFWISRNQNN